MAKKTVTEVITGLPSVLEDIKTKYGEAAIISSDSIVTRPRRIIPVTPALDIGLSGGIPEGSTVLITGIPKFGKNTLALHIAGNAQKMGKNVYINDVEARTKEMTFAGIKHLDRSKIFIINSYKDKTTGETKIFNAEEHLDMALIALKQDPGCIVIIDSIAALRTQGESTLALDEPGKRAPLPTLLTRFFKEAAATVQVNNSVLICLNQVMANPSGKGRTITQKGGFALFHAVDVQLFGTYIEKIKESDKVVGQICHWDVEVSAMGPPHQKADMIIRYGDGVDEVAEIVNLAVAYGLIEQKAAWYIYGEEKMQGEAKVKQYLQANPTVKDELLKQIKEIAL